MLPHNGSSLERLYASPRSREEEKNNTQRTTQPRAAQPGTHFSNNPLTSAENEEEFSFQHRMESQSNIPEYNESEEAVEESGPLHEDQISETASILTLHISQQDHPVSPSESQKETEGVPINYIPASEENKVDRAKTAPSRPCTELEELRASKQFLNLEAAAIAGSQLIERSDSKFDLDSMEGQQNCKKFLQELEKLFDSFKAHSCSRKYRSKFSQAYKVLYKENTICYLTEILDSAQEGFHYLWVNSEKYEFSPHVLKAAEELFSFFCNIKHIIRNVYNRYLFQYF